MGLSLITNVNDLPNLATKYNGVWLEMAVPFFRTLKVSGRRMPGIDYSSVENIFDGDTLMKRRKTSRTLNVAFYIEGDDTKEIDKSLDLLAQILNTKEVEIIFNDEPDKFYKGMFTGFSEGGTGFHENKQGFVGNLTFYCSDPLRYSTTLKEFDATLDENGIIRTTIVNNGTETVPISYEIKHHHENGFIGIVTEDGSIQYGSSEEEDVTDSQMLIDYKEGAEFNYAYGGKFISPYIQNGRFRTYYSENKSYVEIDPNNVGSGSYWHGACGYINIPPDSKGERGAKNFKMITKVWFEGTKPIQTAALDICLTDSNNNIIASIQLWDGETANYNTYFDMFVKTQRVNRVTWVSSGVNNWSGPGNNKGNIVISKEGGSITFRFNNKAYTYYDDLIKDSYVTRINIGLTQKSGKGYSEMTWACFERLSFLKIGNGNAYDIKNRYPANSVVTVDGNTSKMYVDGVLSSGDEAIGSIYGKAKPGANIVIFTNSVFSDPPPSFKAIIREAWL